MKKIITLLICLCLVILTYIYFNDITSYILDYIYKSHNAILDTKTEYIKEENYDFVQISKDFEPYSYQELLNIFYTAIDAGYNKITFYCPTEYINCIKDVEKISNKNNIEVLTTLGNYVSPFNNFKTLRVEYDTTGEVTLEINHLYTKEDIDKVNKEIDKIYNEIVKKDMTTEEIIYAFHDYIINHTKYDSAYEEELKTKEITTHESSKATGLLFDGYAICSGYTDTMAIVLDRLGVKNFKLASKTHVWNAVYINNKWLHLDLTWDDPVSQNSDKDTLLHKFYLIDTSTLENFDIEDHTFDKSIYTELK